MKIRPYTTTAGSALALAALLAAGNAQAIEASVSGQVNRAIVYADDGEDTNSAFVDNQNSNSRFRFTGSAEMVPGIRAGILAEFSMVTGSSSAFSIEEQDDGFGFGRRHMDAFFSGDFGAVRLGQGSGAADGGVEVDLSGTSVVQWVGAADIGGGVNFRDEDGGFGPTIGAVTNSFDFESRYQRIRYDSPAFGPLSLAGSFGKKGGAGDDTTELALRYNADFAGVGRLGAALGYSNRSIGGDIGSVETVGGSVSFLHDTGFNVTLAYAQIEDDNELDADNTYIKIGYTTGVHSVALDYGVTSDLGAEGDSEWFGLGYVWRPIGWAELYAGAKIHSHDDVGDQSFDDITMVTTGTRLRF
ncbi:hypothetical protein J2T57_003858 [Natronocella acetinitrilica]|uniref:Porin domain-containing protein n=1 Tax=Natronocella acetinitrilica TaxID=414046 RepID=A0AAE3KHT7_9GAMM|nr:porin [Natronocella acetinitrilica]MCP1676687.1 hypothetical protein [Natronocella acetinitrilica]